MKSSNIIEIKYQNIVHPINYSKFRNFEDIIKTIKNLFQLAISNEEGISLIYYEKDNDFDKISITSIEDIEQISLFHYKNYKYTIQLEVHISYSLDEGSSDLVEETNDNQLHESDINLNLDKILESKVTKIVNSKFNELQSNNLRSKTMTINKISKNVGDDDFEFNPHLLTTNQLLSINDDNNSIHINNNLQEQEKEITKISYSNPLTCSKCLKISTKDKFICILCSMYQLCNNCYYQHAQFHPMLLITNSQNNICSIEELATYLKHQKISKNKESISGIISKLYSVIYPSIVYKLEISPFVKTIHSLVLAQEEIKNFHIVIENLTPKPINSNLFFQIKNSKNLFVKVEPLQGIKSKGMQITDMIITAGINKEEYKLSITLYTRDIQITCNSIKLMIKVVDKKNLEDEIIDMFFKDQVKILQMNKNDKIKLYNIIMKGSITKDEIEEILEKNNYNLNKTLEELLLQIEDNADDDDN